MNYFELFELPVKYNLDKVLLRQRFISGMWSSHPDLDKNADAEKQSSLLNDAYHTLSDDDKRLTYLLQMNGVETEGSGYKLSPLFLGEMLELNEQLSDLEMDSDEFMLENCRSEIDTKITEIENELRQATVQFDQAADAPALAVLTENYFKHRYILRLKERLARFAPR